MNTDKDNNKEQSKPDGYTLLPTVLDDQAYIKELEEQLTLTDVGFSKTEVCGYCNGNKWISEGIRDVPCPSCGCTGVKQT